MITVATIDHNGVRYELVCQELDPSSFDGGAESVEVPIRVQATKAADEKADKS
jgi:hypothetical protein